MEINQYEHLETSQNAKIIKLDNDYKQIWTAWIHPPRNAPEARFVGVAQTLIKLIEINTNDNFETFKNAQISKILQDYD